MDPVPAKPGPFFIYSELCPEGDREVPRMYQGVIYGQHKKYKHARFIVPPMLLITARRRALQKTARIPGILLIYCNTLNFKQIRQSQAKRP